MTIQNKNSWTVKIYNPVKVSETFFLLYIISISEHACIISSIYHVTYSDILQCINIVFQHKSLILTSNKENKHSFHVGAR